MSGGSEAPFHWPGDASLPPTQAVSNAGRRHPDKKKADAGTASRVACTACRNRHLKCDGKEPCGRCKTEQIDCFFVASRRGYKGPKRRTGGPGTMPEAMTNTQPQRRLTISAEMNTSFFDISQHIAETIAVSPDGRFGLNFLSPVDNNNQMALISAPQAQMAVDSSRSGLIDAFYTFFFPAHPFLLPRDAMVDQLTQSNDLLHLEYAILYVGSFYRPGNNNVELRNSLEIALSEALRNGVGAKDAYYVQAKMLFAMGLHMADRSDDSVVTMLQAVQCALGLRMWRQNFPAETHGNETILQECLRRTWWELFVWDGILCGVNPAYQLQLGNVALELALPIDDEAYIQGRIAYNHRFLHDYTNSAFMSEEEEPAFSSGTYRIAAVRIIHKVLAATRTNPVDEVAFESAETDLKNWALHLPDSKTQVIGHDGQVDEVLFTAHMVIASCCIILNRPRSDLSHEDVHAVTTCVSGGPTCITSNNTSLHTAHAMGAAKDICALIKMPSPLIKHTPFFTCAITMSAVAYLSYWSFMATQDGDNTVKEHIKLNIGSLKTYSTTMPIAKTILGQVQSVARELFQSRKALSNVYWASVTREETFQTMIEESTSAIPNSSLLAPASIAGWDVGFFSGCQ